MEQTAATGLGFAHFLTHTDAIGYLVLTILLTLSLASWYLIVTRALTFMQANRRAAKFLDQFWNAKSLTEVDALLKTQAPDNAFAELARQGLQAKQELEAGVAQKLTAAGGLNDYLTRVLRNGLDLEAARSEFGLTILATAGSASPYVGLFGTVWGIYHALVQIGMSGQGTLDKVAGPVGEALIMTALGLAVAIPAVLAYNAFNRRNRMWMARLDAFAHDL
ncbi:MAG: MotA/TolQ/ExbB proton channel family protein, partial [Burkholderiaceae bacterium]|nr:MotA/TolQ/ExbB proton channel family protein [Burkholderiaceae bacterium]